MKFKTLQGTDVREYTVNMGYRMSFYTFHVTLPVYGKRGKLALVDLIYRDPMYVEIGNRHYDMREPKDFKDMKCMFRALLENEKTKTAIESLD